MLRAITLPEMVLWTATRVALGAGIGMLVSRRLNSKARKATGIALTAVGAASTVPLAIRIFGGRGGSRKLQSVA